MPIEYDSDSTEGEYTETSVLLGYASRDADEDIISKLGGRPDWIESNQAPSAALARCRGCQELMALLLQLNGELPERFPGHERRLYVFACRKSSCRRKEGSIRVLRAVRVWEDEVPAPKGTAMDVDESAVQHEKSKPTTSAASASGLGESLFGAKTWGGGASGGNPFASNTDSSNASSGLSSGSANPFSSASSHSSAAAPEQSTKEAPSVRSTATLSKTFAESLSLNAPAGQTWPQPSPIPSESWPDSDSLPRPYPTLYLSEADYETLDQTPEKTPANVRIEDADAEEPSILDREAFESSMDATFQKFADRLAQNPDQVIRYEFAGTPLLYSKTDAVADKFAKGTLPGCGNCGARRTFEVQLTPNAIAELEADEMDLEGMEWGTVIVGVCEKDCAPRQAAKGVAGYLEEWVGVQWEELSKE
ncbi:putative 20S rRNA accumulation protein 4 [Drechmeria coniospora]|uniref:Putative 20S rRNA accumulation protein 4 n=1 Tax=Drechmeria coniospora TaxID=98403 RepID=A0A151GCI8_DRECN|nr:putative 20S rRNA accumulation protein 4 [Drechmeria coniospora]KYK54755.1 putative 20S rRNA accumulation protein 4 [Drechmeria coniospora]ODA76017.1 hypothetical protein RJ55_08299 [Drechmeria coniospora]